MPYLRLARVSSFNFPLKLTTSMLARGAFMLYAREKWKMLPPTGSSHRKICVRRSTTLSGRRCTMMIHHFIHFFLRTSCETFVSVLFYHYNTSVKTEIPCPPNNSMKLSLVCLSLAIYNVASFTPSARHLNSFALNLSDNDGLWQGDIVSNAGGTIRGCSVTQVGDSITDWTLTIDG